MASTGLAPPPGAFLHELDQRSVLGVQGCLARFQHKVHKEIDGLLFIPLPFAKRFQDVLAERGAQLKLIVECVKVTGGHEPFASHVSCMTWFHHTGRLHQEVGSCVFRGSHSRTLQERDGIFPGSVMTPQSNTAALCRRLSIVGNFQLMWERTSPTCWRP
ncbi:unnamed protein product [Pleuronectes platessa]|uniref:Uncharacterized protein n=1 Tax=Pleuronectes platessa TaxID=8262 RepID=A0A9N7ZE07_PLEPL|nr:unnamed protein product [Pleuronectes platessa]